MNKEMTLDVFLSISTSLPWSHWTGSLMFDYPGSQKALGLHLSLPPNVRVTGTCSHAWCFMQMLGIWTQILLFVEQKFFPTELSPQLLQQILWSNNLWSQWLIPECYPWARDLVEVLYGGLCASLVSSSVNYDHCHRAFIHDWGPFLFNLILKFALHLYPFYGVDKILHLILNACTVFHVIVASPWRVSCIPPSVAQSTCCRHHSGWGVVAAPHHPCVHLMNHLHAEVTLFLLGSCLRAESWWIQLNWTRLELKRTNGFSIVLQHFLLSLCFTPETSLSRGKWGTPHHWSFSFLSFSGVVVVLELELRHHRH